MIFISIHIKVIMLPAVYPLVVQEFRLVMLPINGRFPFGCMAFPTN